MINWISRILQKIRKLFLSNRNSRTLSRSKQFAPVALVLESRALLSSSSALTLGVVRSEPIHIPGDVDTYTFNLAAPSHLWFDSQTNDGNLLWQLSGPTGVIPTLSTGTGAVPFSYDDQDLGLLPTGDYTLVVSANSDYTGTYAFNLMDLGAASSLTIGTAATPTGPTLTGTLAPGNNT